jgi:hypothetical protein
MALIKFDIALHICLVSDYTHKWYHRDAKRIMKGIAWNSRKIKYDETYSVYPIQDRNQEYKYWLAEHIQNKITGEVRVIPMYEVEIVGNTSNPDYFKIKRK